MQKLDEVAQRGPFSNTAIARRLGIPELRPAELPAELERRPVEPKAEPPAPAKPVEAAKPRAGWRLRHGKAPSSFYCDSNDESADKSRNAFERSKCAWWKGWGSNTRLPGLAPRLLAPFIADCFNYERWRDTGLLDAGGQDEYGGGIGMRHLSTKSGLSLRSVTSAIRALEKAGAFRVERGSFNPKTGRWAANKYIAIHFTATQQTEGSPVASPATGPSPK